MTMKRCLRENVKSQRQSQRSKRGERDYGSNEVRRSKETLGAPEWIIEVSTAALELRRQSTVDDGVAAGLVEEVLERKRLLAAQSHLSTDLYPEAENDESSASVELKSPAVISAFYSTNFFFLLKNSYKFLIFSPSTI